MSKQERLQRDARESSRRSAESSGGGGSGGSSPVYSSPPATPRVAALEARLKQADEQIHQLVTHGGE
jgi:hypothetical protein